MRAVDIIIKKRNCGELSKEEINFFIEGFTDGSIPDYQAAAWAMAVLIRGMTAQETTYLTLAMAASGETLDLSKVVPVAVDKHSTGGVGDKTSMTVGPIVAACGLPVGKMSGRGLGFSGGTLDKLESIPGFRVDLSTEEFIEQLRDIGFVLTGQSMDLAPADGKMYALRDVTGTVQSIPLIASSVMSKKIAAGAQAIVLDVKVGRGAFMETLEQARELADLMVSIGKLSGRNTIAVLSNMEEPLGSAVGNALELKEAVRALNGEGPEDYLVHCKVIAAHMLLISGKVPDMQTGEKQVLEVIQNGQALTKFKQLVERQGGDVAYIDDLNKLPKAKFTATLKAETSGWIETIDARIVGETAVNLGAGRAKKGDPIDPAVGILVYGKVGKRVEEGDILYEIHANDELKLEAARKQLRTSIKITPDEVSPLPVFYGVIS